MSVRSRIAPTPSGYLHTGNVFNFLLTYLLVRAGKGTLRLRIDDLDAPRVRSGYIHDIFDTLNWIGIRWEEGPAAAAEAARFSQSLRRDRYDRLLDELSRTGRVFACTCSRQTVLAHSPDGQYPGTCRHKRLPLDTPDAAWRLITPEDAVITFEDGLAGRQSVDLHRTGRDFIVRRRDGLPAYHIASLADDLDFGINTIVRGVDLLPSTAAQLYLARLLDAANFTAVRFCHHPLLSDEGGAKLSKSAGSAAVRSVREVAEGREALLRQAAGWLRQTGAARLLPGDMMGELDRGRLPDQ